MTDDLDLPCPHALLAATLALMTTYAEPNPEARVDALTLRGLLARKIVSNLFFLWEHPALGAPMRQVVGTAHGRWVALAGGPSSGSVDTRKAAPRERDGVPRLH